MQLGIDGCRSGWVVAAGSSQNDLSLHVLPDTGAIWQIYHQAERILIDIPIGFPESGERECEAAARTLLQARRSSVFMVPVRAALYAKTYEEASQINHQRTGKKLSRQTWNIVPKMQEVDQFLQENPGAPLYESHPEVVFTALAGYPMRYSKKRGLGFVERLQVIEHFIPQALIHIQKTISKHPRRLNEDDIIDAMVLWIAAGMQPLHTLPEHPQCDAKGILMQIMYPDFADQTP